LRDATDGRGRRDETRNRIELYAAGKLENNRFLRVGFLVGAARERETGMVNRMAMKHFNTSAAALLAATVLFSISGCGGDSPASPASPAGAKPPTDAAKAASEAKSDAAPTAEQVLARMTAAYRNAATYEDGAQVFFTFVEEGQKYDEGPIPYSVAFERPNRLRLNMFQAAIVSDGEKLWAATSDIPGQVLEADAPAGLTTENIASGGILDHAMRGGLPLRSPQLALLLGKGLTSEKQGPAKLLEERTLDERPCYRVELPRPDGAEILWIDKENFVLRRVELPSEPIRQVLDPQGRLQEMKIWIDLKGARLGGEVADKAFQFEMPEGAVAVGHFVPPLSNPPPRIGETLADFEFAALDGAPITSKGLGGEVRVLDFWFTTCAPCRESMPHLQELYEEYKDDDRVRFLAVSIDGDDVKDEDVKKTLESWGVHIPIARDVKQQAGSLFKIPGAPTLFLLDAENKIHAYQPGVASSYEDLRRRIDALLAGENVAGRMLANYEAEREAFELELQKASVKNGGELIEVPRAEIAPRSEPKLLQLTELWRAESVKEPGNLLVVEEEGDTRIFALDGWRTVVELDTQGREVARHELPIPRRTGVSFLRTAVDGQGKRYYVAAAVSQQQLHLFDENWKPLMSFPEGRHAGIADVRFADLDANGQLELIVGYWGDVGAQGVSLDGKRLWANRGMQNVIQVAVDDPDVKGRRRAICVNSRGTLVPVDDQGENAQDVRVNSRALTNIAIADLDGDGVSEWCALAADPNELGRFTAVGVSPRGEELWSYDLPEGLHKYLIERIVPGQLAPGDGGWLLPAADGSIHLLTKDGQLVDRFNYGKALTGLALYASPQGPVLLVADSEGLTAWQVGRRE
jgi:thiol-disulfide isomerase/thioredoxin/outer membrane lipoprotein-sorting protein